MGLVFSTSNPQLESRFAGLSFDESRPIHIDTYPPTSKISNALDCSYSNLLRDRSLLRLAHLPESASSGKSLIITPEKGIQPVQSIDLLPEQFSKVLESRINNHHYRTELTRVANLPGTITDDLKEIAQYTKLWSSYCLFPQYEMKDSQYTGAEFGFVAKRTNAGTLITARASNKKEPGTDDFALITSINNNTINVTSTKRKASLNAPLAHYIFEHRPEIKYIVHSHIFLPEGANASKLSSPSTHEDWQSIESLVKSGAKIINQPLHGTLILLERPEELLEILKRNSLYHNNSRLYDLAYARFIQRKTSLEATIEKLNLSKDSRVLDLCCGTGASTLALKELGFTNIDIADGSRSMLDVAEKRLQKQGAIIELPSLDGLKTDYELITMRQAFNYISPELTKVFAKNIAEHLNEGGKFVFNTFGVLAPGIKQRNNPDLEDQDTLIRTQEINHIDRTKVLHTQRSEIVDFNLNRWDAVLDINEFYQHDLDTVVNEFRQAGFKVDTSVDGNSVCFTCTKGAKA